MDATTTPTNQEVVAAVGLTQPSFRVPTESYWLSASLDGGSGQDGPGG